MINTRYRDSDIHDKEHNLYYKFINYFSPQGPIQSSTESSATPKVDLKASPTEILRCLVPDDVWSPLQLAYLVEVEWIVEKPGTQPFRPVHCLDFVVAVVARVQLPAVVAKEQEAAAVPGCESKIRVGCLVSGHVR